MKLIDTIQDYFKKELPVSEAILDREKRFNQHDDSREKWVLSHTYLCEGDLEALKDISADIRAEYAMTYYATPEGVKGPCKRVIVSIQGRANDTEKIKELEKKLKLNLFSRGCNSGIFYRNYERKGQIYAEAVPAVLTRE